MTGYEDIIHLPHHVSVRHPQMSRQDRAAQFAPFAALTGHKDAIRESEATRNEFCIVGAGSEKGRWLLPEEVRMYPED